MTYILLYLWKCSKIYIFVDIGRYNMSKKNLILKKERFKNVAAKRVQKVLDSLDSLSKCANRNNYDYTDVEVSKMLKAIKEQVRLLEISYTEKTKSKTKTFEF
jgi:hypothetical protein